MSKLKELREKRGKIHADCTELLKAEQTAETRAKVDVMLSEIDTIKADIDRIERADKLNAENAITNPAGAGAPDAKATQASYRNAWKEYLKRGDSASSHHLVEGGINQETSDILYRTRRELMAPGLSLSEREKRDQEAGTQSISYTQGAAGGFFVPAGFVYDVEKATKYYAPLLDGNTIRVMETATGNVLPYPTNNDTNEAWTILGEAVQVNDRTGTNASYSASGQLTVSQVGNPLTQPGNLTIGQVTFGAFKGSTGHIKVSLELLQDSAFNIEDFLMEAFAVRLGRGYEYYLTVGSGVGQPTGFITAILASGATPVTAAGSSANDGSSNTGANSVGYQDLVNLEHSVDPSYRRGAKFQMHDNTLRFLKTLLDKFGRPLWVPGMKEGAPDTILGYPVVINQSMDTIAASKNTVAFGQWSKFIARKVRDLQVLRLDERFADFAQVSYVGFSRLDSQLIDAGSHPLSLLQMHS